MASLRILQLLAQRPGLTGSGVTIDSLAREQVAAGHDVHMVVGVPSDEPLPSPPAGLDAERVHPLTFGPGGDLPFPVVGMSDVMPYRSTVWSDLDDAQWQAYAQAWRQHLARVIDRVQPDVIHAHHVWLMASLVKDVAPERPLVVHCHATGLRQMKLCPDRAAEVVAGVRLADAFLALHDGHRDELVGTLRIEQERVHVVGAGFDERVFHAEGRAPEPDTLGFVGKLSLAKGVQPLLDACDRLAERRPGLRVRLATVGSGAEAEALADRIEASPWAESLGRLHPTELAARLRRTEVFVLPSFYEGLPLVLAEARACGCRLVATALPGIEWLARSLGDALQLVDMPPLISVDRPDPDALPEFTARLVQALGDSLDRPSLPVDPAQLEPFRWQAVARRIDTVLVAVRADRA